MSYSNHTGSEHGGLCPQLSPLTPSQQALPHSAFFSRPSDGKIEVLSASSKGWTWAPCPVHLPIILAYATHANPLTQVTRHILRPKYAGTGLKVHLKTYANSHLWGEGCNTGQYAHKPTHEHYICSPCG